MKNKPTRRTSKKVGFVPEEAPSPPAEGRVAHILGAAQDIKKSKQAKEALRESEEHDRLFQGILQSTSDGILAVNRENEVFFANERFVEMWRIPQKVMAGKNDTLLLQYVLDQLSDPQRFLGKVQELYHSAEESFDTLYFKDGRVFERLSRPMLQGMQLQGRVWSFRDITGRKQAEQAVEDSNRRIKSILECAGEGIFGLNLAGEHTFVNPAAASMLGYETIDELISRHSHSTWHYARPNGDPYPVKECPIYTTLHDGKTHLAEEYFWRKDGSGFPVLFSSKPILENEKIVGAVVSFRDITERKQIEGALAASEAELRALFASMYDVALVIDRQGVYRKIAPTNPGLLVKPPKELLGKNLTDVFPPEKAEAFRGIVQQVLDTKQNAQIEYELIIGGRTVWFQTTISPLNTDSTLWVAHDITNRKQSEEALRASQQIIEGIINSIPVRVFWKDKNLIFLGCNVNFARDAGFADPKDIIGKDDYQMVWRDQAELYRDDDRQIIESGSSKLLIEEPHTTPEGNINTVLTSKIPLRDSKGEISGILGTYMDITERKRAEEALQAAKSNYRSIFENATVGIYQSTPQGHLLNVNPAMARIFGYDSPQEMLNNISDIEDQHYVDPDDRLEFQRLLMDQGEVHEIISLNRRLDGEHIWVQENARAVKDVDGNILHYEGFITDITERVQAEEDLRRAKDALETVNLDLQQSLEREKLLACTDGLTGLYNHRHFFELAAREFHAAVRHRRPLTFLMFDMDDFKQVNDTLGHSAGDKLLAMVAQTAVAQVRASDVVSRYGGDEFIVMLPHASAEQVLPIAERIRTRVAALRVDALHDDKEPFVITLSIGIAEMRHEPVDENVEHVIQRADEAMYKAKQSGRNRTVIFGQDETGAI